VSETASSRDEFSQRLIVFVTTLVRRRTNGAGNTAAIEIDRSTPLFSTGLIDSLGILELMAFVEEATGTPVPIQKVDMRYFGTVDRISRSFWPDTAGGRA
jgi:acyl carrier protein